MAYTDLHIASYIAESLSFSSLWFVICIYDYNAVHYIPLSHIWSKDPIGL